MASSESKDMKRIKLQNTITGKFYANGKWESDWNNAQAIKDGSPELAVVHAAWEMDFVVEMDARWMPCNYGYKTDSDQWDQCKDALDPWGGVISPGSWKPANGRDPAYFEAIVTSPRGDSITLRSFTGW
jgi:hypothetical protein